VELKNYIEQMVLEQLEEIMAKHGDDICGCQRCRLDIAALALNQLPPKYVVSPQGKAYAKAETLTQQFNVDVLLALNKAMAVVKANPRHG